MGTVQPKAVNPTIESDVELQHRILRFLQLKNIHPLEDLSVSVKAGTVTLLGQLPSPRERFSCLECCRHVPGVLKVQDQLTIHEDDLRNNRHRVPG